MCCTVVGMEIVSIHSRSVSMAEVGLPTSFDSHPRDISGQYLHHCFNMLARGKERLDILVKYIVI